MAPLLEKEFDLGVLCGIGLFRLFTVRRAKCSPDLARSVGGAQLRPHVTLIAPVLRTRAKGQIGIFSYVGLLDS